MDDQTAAAENTDREIWREKPGDYYSPSIHVTQEVAGRCGIGIDVGGTVIVMDVREWHRLASNIGGDRHAHTQRGTQNEKTPHRSGA